MPTRQPRQSRNLTSALGDRNAQLTVYGVWLTGIALGVIAILLVVLPNLFNNTKAIPGNFASADLTDQKQLSPAQLKDHADAGLKAFAAARCTNCHLENGTSAAGPGPRLSTSHNARDAAYVITVIRQGVGGNGNQGGMPYFLTIPDGTTPTNAQRAQYQYLISNQQIYDITVYLRTIQIAPRGVDIFNTPVPGPVK